MERVYKQMKKAGAANITVGVLLIVLGITFGILNIVAGGKLLKKGNLILNDSLRQGETFAVLHVI